MPSFPSQDFNNQYISESYQNVLQKFTPTGSTHYILNGSGDVVFSFQSASLGGQLVTSDQTVTHSISASYAPGSPSISASYAQTASIVIGQPTIKSGFIASSSFFGTLLSASVTFATTFPSGYSLSIIAEDARVFTVESKSLNGFTISSNSEVALSGSVYWQAISYGEYNS